MFHNRDVLNYLSELIIKDLANHFKGDPTSLMSADNLDFTLSSADIKFRRDILKYIIQVQNDPTARQLVHSDTSTINEYNWHTKLNQGAVKEIADGIQKGHRIAAIKALREATGFGLREAKQIIDSFFDNLSPHLSEIDYQRAANKFKAKCYGGVTNVMLNKPWEKL